ncbi:unnamed protein product [Colias eurytheme]|nr:unnamed protein product [Colias eurytheme]
MSYKQNRLHQCHLTEAIVVKLLLTLAERAVLLTRKHKTTTEQIVTVRRPQVFNDNINKTLKFFTGFKLATSNNFNMSDTETSFDTSDEDILLLQKVVAEQTARELGQEPSESRDRSTSTTSQSSTTSSSAETSSSYDEVSDLELALALKKLHDKELKRLRQMIVSLRACRKKLIEVLVEKRKMDILSDRAKAAATE